MAQVINDLSDRLARFPIAYGKHAVKGVLAKHIIDASGTTKEITIQQALGQASQLFFDTDNNPFYVGGGWDALEKLYYGPQGAGVEITADYHFHSGGAADAVDALFPDDGPHPRASYYSAKLPAGIADDNDPGNMFGIFRTLRIANYNEDGEQIDDADDPISVDANPDDYLYYSASPMREIADLYRRSRRNLVNINWPAWCYLRDWHAALIDWDDGKLTPHQIKVVPAAGGALAPGTKIWVRIASLKAGDISSASQDVADDGYTEAAAVVGGGGAVAATWTSQLDRGADGYRVYVGTAKGAEDRYFVVGSGATNTLTIDTLAGATMGAPPEIATGALLRQIPRFESHIFMVQPFSLAAAMDRIAQITCSDWNYANGKLVMVSPELQEPIITLDRSLLTNFKTYPVDRRENWNQILGTYRDLDDPNLAPAAKPVEVNRFDLQSRDGLKSKEINFGCAYRSQVERACNYWARRLIDSNQMTEKFVAPSAYRLLPANAIAVTHDVPNWTDVPFYIEEKEENEDSKAGYQMTARIYGEWYSDTDHNPMPRPLPQTNPSVFVAPPVIDDVTLSVQVVEQATGDAYLVIRGEVQFAAYAGEQRGRVWIKKPGGAYERTQMVFPPEPVTLQGSFEWPVVALGDYKIKVVTESRLGATADFADHPEFALTVTDDLLRGPEPTNLNPVFDEDNGNILYDWEGTPAKGGSSREKYDFEVSIGSGAFVAARSITDIQRNELPQFLSWEQTAGSLPVTLFSPGGIGLSAHLTNIAIAQSKQKASIAGPTLFQFETSDLWHIPVAVSFHPEDEDPLMSDYALKWTRDSRGGGDAYPDPEVGIGENPNHPVQVYADGETVTGSTMLPGDRFYILIDRGISFGKNFLGRASTPLHLSPRNIKPNTKYRVTLFSSIDDSVVAESGNIRNAQIIRFDPEWLYIAKAQKDDNSSSLPATGKARVRQHSFYTNGPPSNWVEITWTRP